MHKYAQQSDSVHPHSMKNPSLRLAEWQRNHHHLFRGIMINHQPVPSNQVPDQISKEAKWKECHLHANHFNIKRHWNSSDQEKEKRNRNLICFRIFFSSSSSFLLMVRSKSKSNGLLITWHRSANVYNYADHSLGVFAAQLIVKCVNKFVRTNCCCSLRCARALLQTHTPNLYNNIHFEFYFCWKTADHWFACTAIWVNHSSM